MKIKFLVLISLVFPNIALCQSVTVQTQTNAGVQEGGKMVTDENGNIYSFGRFTDTLTIGMLNVVSAGYFDMYLVKMDAQLQPSWLMRLGGAFDDGAGDISYYNGKLYVTGWYAGQFTIGSDTFFFDATYNQYPGMMAVVDTNGVVIDTKSFQTANSISGYATSIAVTDSGVVIGGAMKGEMNFGNGVTIQSYMTGTETDIFIAKMNHNLDAIWAYRNNSVSGANNCFDGLTDIVMDDSAYIYVGGYFGSNPTLNSASLYWGNYTLVSNGGFGFSDFFFGKLTPQGAPLWLYASGGGLPDAAARLCLYNDTTLVLAGRYSDQSDIAGIALPASPNDYSKFIATVNSNGTPLSAYRINAGTDYYALKKGADGYMYGADMTNTINNLHIFRFDVNSGIVFEDSISTGNHSYHQADILPPTFQCANLTISTSFKDVFAYNNDTLANHTAANGYVDLMLCKYFPAGTGLAQPVISAVDSTCADTAIVLTSSVVAGASIYHWSVNPASAGTITGTGSLATLNSAAGFSGPVYIHCYVSNFCGTSAAADSIQINLLATPYNVTWTGGATSVSATILNADTVYWFFNSNPLPAYTNAGSVPCLGTGTYTVTGINLSGCSLSSSQFFVCTTGIKEETKNLISAYPQPADEILFLKAIGVKELKVYSVYGSEMLLKTVDNNTINTSALPDGVYIYKIISSGGYGTGKFIVKH